MLVARGRCVEWSACGVYARDRFGVFTEPKSSEGPGFALLPAAQ